MKLAGLALGLGLVLSVSNAHAKCETGTPTGAGIPAKGSLYVHADSCSAPKAGGPIVAAGLFPGAHGLASYWGGASRTAAQRLLPNEALLWQAITRWKERGARAFDFGGGGAFKEKFGGTPIEVAWARHTRPAALRHGRRLAAAVLARRAGT